ncbi:hypothetical protein BY996DRAFT_6416611 [Phakopsora pachyrhizi]|nr:hypothetical protein BY996DRAFT_6416611 [Phakopsora pachyrhizi]
MPLPPLTPPPRVASQPFQPRSGGWSSRQSSLPSLMSMPPTRAASPDQTASSSSSSQHQHLNGSLSSRLLPHSSALNSVFRAQNQASGSSSPSFYQKSSSSSPLAAVNAAFAIGSTGSTNVSQGRSSSRVLKHYERVRSPSLRGHSRTTSFSELAIPSKLNSPSILNFSPRDRNSASVEFEMPIELGEETLRPEEESRSFDFQCDWSGEDNFEYNGLNEARKVFKPGERIGVGIFHQGHRVRNVFEASEGVSRRLSLCSSGPAGSGLLEIVGQIGVGTYAVVYLVREVLYDPDLELDSTHPDTSLSQTPRASDGFAALSPESGQPSTISLRRRRKSSSIIYGRDFALKCLCKQNLSRELLMIQRGEAELHQSLPLHENIVSLYWALETPNWLFMVIEYCPGQDLFYWLEQSKDSQDLESLASRANSYSAKFPSFTSDHTTTFRSSMSAPFELLPKPSEPTSMDHNTPPSPSLLATTADDEMLSRRRLRLISRMFVQMCDAVQACHLAGVCHRDIKPENFIVVDYRQSNSSSSHEREKSVIVKITDWGLGTSSKICEDFDCGSKPYMSYECRNNLHPCYAPAPADVWSLGIVLLNLLYHRCPWSDPSLTDADFNQFKRDPINFFCGRFEGMTGSVAEFLANRVFCEVGYNEAGHRKERITAGEFGEWAKDLLSHMGGGQLHASVSDSTIVMSPSVGRSGLFYGDTLPPSEASKVSHNPLLQLLNSPTISDCESRDSKFSEAGNRRKGLVKKLSDLFLEPSLKLNFAAAASDPIRGDYDEDAMLFEEEEERRLSAKLLFEKGREGYYDESRRVADSETQLERGSRCLIKGKRVEFPGKRLETKNVTTISLPTMEATASDEHDGFSDVSQNFLPENNELKKVLNQEKGFSNIGRRRLNLAGRMLEKFRDGSNPELQAFVKQSKSLEASLLRAPQPHNNYVPPHVKI